MTASDLQLVATVSGIHLLDLLLVHGGHNAALQLERRAELVSVDAIR